MNDVNGTKPKVLALCGGVGGAKLALGLYRILPPHSLLVSINTGDDFQHLGLHISPDIDTVIYTLAGLNDVERGWGLAGETWNFMDALSRLGGEIWFNLGDKDLATHVERTRRLKAGESLSAITGDFANRLGITALLMPMTDSSVATIVCTDEGRLAFQSYFVERQCRPQVQSILFEGAEAARIQPEVATAIADVSLDAIVICPSNPYLSVDPILALPGMRAALAAAPAPVVAVSPIIGGAAVKGPTAKIMTELGLPVTSHAVAAHYSDFLDGFVLDETDAADMERIDVPVLFAQTLMRTVDDRESLARSVVDFAASLR